MSPDIAVEAEGLVKSFKDTKALKGVSLQVPRGKVLGVLGPNGAGKTTAVRILATLLRPDAGHAIVAGYDVVRHPREVRKRVGLTGQYASVDEELTGRENLVMIAELLNMRMGVAKARAAELLDWFDLSDAADRMARTYSGGMRRRLDLAASLTGHPEIVFLDEPTTGLDPAKREDMWDVVRAIVANGTSVLLTTQYLEEADALADDIVVINHGEVIAHDTAENLKRVVGSQTLRVRPTRLESADAVRGILAVVATDGAHVDESRGGELSVPVPDGSVLAGVVGRLQAASIEVTELSLMLPSLDEVFFTLTGERNRTVPGATDATDATDATEEVNA
jgi:oleandomycin transport system ATP-binding protein